MPGELRATPCWPPALCWDCWAVDKGEEARTTYLLERSKVYSKHRRQMRDSGKSQGGFKYSKVGWGSPSLLGIRGRCYRVGPRAVAPQGGEKLSDACVPKTTLPASQKHPAGVYPSGQQIQLFVYSVIYL